MAHLFFKRPYILFTSTPFLSYLPLLSLSLSLLSLSSSSFSLSLSLSLYVPIFYLFLFPSNEMSHNRVWEDDVRKVWTSLAAFQKHFRVK